MGREDGELPRPGVGTHRGCSGLRLAPKLSPSRLGQGVTTLAAPNWEDPKFYNPLSIPEGQSSLTRGPASSTHGRQAWHPSPAVRGDESPKGLPAGFSCPSRFPRPPVAATWIPPGKGQQAKMLSFVCTTARLSGSIHLGLPSVPNFLPVPVVRGKPFFFFNYVF